MNFLSTCISNSISSKISLVKVVFAGGNTFGITFSNCFAFSWYTSSKKETKSESFRSKNLLVEEKQGNYQCFLNNSAISLFAVHLQNFVVWSFRGILLNLDLEFCRLYKKRT